MYKTWININRFEEVGKFVNIMDRIEGSAYICSDFQLISARSVISMIGLVGKKNLELLTRIELTPEIKTQLQYFGRTAS